MPLINKNRHHPVSLQSSLLFNFLSRLALLIPIAPEFCIWYRWAGSDCGFSSEWASVGIVPIPCRLTHLISFHHLIRLQYRLQITLNNTSTRKSRKLSFLPCRILCSFIWLLLYAIFWHLALRITLFFQHLRSRVHHILQIKIYFARNGLELPHRRRLIRLHEYLIRTSITLKILLNYNCTQIKRHPFFSAEILILTLQNLPYH